MSREVETIHALHLIFVEIYDTGLRKIGRIQNATNDERLLLAKFLRDKFKYEVDLSWYTEERVNELIGVK